MADSKQVGNYYDQFTDGYLKTYGDTIQAFRPGSTEDLHQYVISSAGLKDGMDILDAGCGVCGPSSYFATHLNVQIEAVSISEGQVRQASEAIHSKGLQSKIRVTQGDYHDLDTLYAGKKFDRILFLESLGHAQNPEKVINAAAALLKDEGCIYIKDFFPFDIEDANLLAKHQRVINNINKWYEYNVLNLHDTVKNLRKNKLEIVYVRKMMFQDDIQARFDFEEMFNVDLFEELEEFRVAEWLELLFRKPSWPLF